MTNDKSKKNVSWAGSAPVPCTHPKRNCKIPLKVLLWKQTGGSTVWCRECDKAGRKTKFAVYTSTRTHTSKPGNNGRGSDASQIQERLKAENAKLRKQLEEKACVQAESNGDEKVKTTNELSKKDNERLKELSKLRAQYQGVPEVFKDFRDKGIAEVDEEKKLILARKRAALPMAEQLAKQKSWAEGLQKKVKDSESEQEELFQQWVHKSDVLQEQKAKLAEAQAKIAELAKALAEEERVKARDPDTMEVEPSLVEDGSNQLLKLFKPSEAAKLQALAASCAQSEEFKGLQQTLSEFAIRAAKSTSSPPAEDLPAAVPAEEVPAEEGDGEANLESLWEEHKKDRIKADQEAGSAGGIEELDTQKDKWIEIHRQAIKGKRQKKN